MTPIEANMTDGNRPVRLAFRTTGCKVNQFDSESVAAAVADLPVEICGPGDGADIIVVNACTVTMNADRDGRAAAYRAARTGARVIVAGCLATRLEDQDSKGTLPESLSIVGGTADRSRLVAAIREMISAVSMEIGSTHTREPLSRLDSIAEPTDDLTAATPAGNSTDERNVVQTENPAEDDVPTGRSRPLIKIQDGCDCRCSYCIVPLVRGPSVSAELETILGRVRAAAASGASEVVLTGVDLAAWGRDEDGRYGHLADLLRLLTAHTPGVRFRLSSLEPYGLDGDLVKAIGENNDICRHLHIPMQSGSDTVLTRMNRPYSSGRFFRLVNDAAASIPGLVLGMDVIVGFPGETDDEFEQTRSMILDLPTTYLHVFPYSPRPGTPAADMPDQVPDAIKKERGAILRKISTERRTLHAMRTVGKQVETVDIRVVDGGVEALASDYTKVLVTNRFDMRPGRRTIKIADCTGIAVAGTDVT